MRSTSEACCRVHERLRDVTGGYGARGYLLVDEGVWVLVRFGIHSCCLVVGLVLGLCRVEALLQMRPRGEQVMQPLDISPRSLEVQILNGRARFQLHKEALLLTGFGKDGARYHLNRPDFAMYIFRVCVPVHSRIQYESAGIIHVVWGHADAKRRSQC